MTKTSALYLIGFNYKNLTAKELSEKTGVKHKTIHEIARRMKLQKIPNWSDFELNILKKFGAKQASILLSRSLASCRTKKSRNEKIQVSSRNCGGVIIPSVAMCTRKI